LVHKFVTRTDCVWSFSARRDFRKADVRAVTIGIAADQLWPKEWVKFQRSIATQAMASSDPFFALELSGCYFQDLPFKRLL